MTRSVEQPYQGTRPFLQTDSSRFFGRQRDAVALAESWRSKSLTVVVGPTASGKTSLLQAGLLPLVEHGRAEVLPPGRVSYGSTFPSAGLPEHNPYALGVLSSWSPSEPVTRLVGMGIGDYIRQRAERHDGPILALIDQAEDLFTGTGLRKAHQRQFLGELAAAVREAPRLHLLLSVRESAFDDLSHAIGGGVQHRIGPLDFTSALQAVTGPTDRTFRSFSPGAAEEIVKTVLTSYIDHTEDLSRPVADYAQPSLLQVVCARFWNSLPSELAIITQRDVRRYADADAALAACCGRVIAAIADDHDLSAARLRTWLVRTFVTELGTLGTTYEGLADTAGMPNAVAHALEDRHLLAAERRSGSRWYSLLSERLIVPLRQSTDEKPLSMAPAEYLQAAERALTLGELDLAERYAKETLRFSCEDLRLQARARSLLGNLACERVQNAEAVAQYREAASLFDAVRDIASVAHQLVAVGATLLAQRRPAEALDELRAAVGRLPNDHVVQTELGWTLWELGQGRAAVDIFTGVLATDGGNVEALRGRGEALAGLGDFPGALRDLDRMAATDRPSTRAARGLALSGVGRNVEARKELNAVLTDAPRNGPVLLYAAQAEALNGDQSAAAELAERALYATDPSLSPHQRETAQRLIGPILSDG
jgi:tetratricopeptide (TPR) repeat protein